MKRHYRFFIALIGVLFLSWHFFSPLKIERSFSIEDPSLLLTTQAAGGAASRCGCSASSSLELEEKANTTILFALRKPQRRFHSNHWFHDGEYFLAKQSSELTSVVASGDTILVMANEVKFVQQLTPMAAMLILLALSPDGSASRLEFFEPSFLYKRKLADGKWGSFASYGPGFVYDSKAPMLDRFSSAKFGSRGSSMGRGKSCYCGKFVGGLGKAPTGSSRWFTSASQITNMRAKVLHLCSMNPNSTTSTFGTAGSSKTDTRLFKLVIYDRNSNRRFLHLDAILTRLKAELEPHRWKIVMVTHDEGMHPCTLQNVLSDADVYLTTHGFQATALIYMKPGAVLIEVFPYKYWKNSYIALSRQFQIHHRWIQNQEPTSASRFALRFVSQSTCMSFNRCRSHARGDSVAMPEDHLQLVIQTAIQVQLGQLGEHNKPTFDFDSS